ncbi:MAG: phosphate ABC transporter ATP-binding protein [Nitrospirae bacterium]|nr:phosphate ABC transporter ATP-binding protein [Nitrospirota bacterium]
MSLSVRLDGTGVSYGPRAALKGVTCGFPAGKVSAILGPNGSGKTTLMRAVAGLEVPGSGSIAYLDATGPVLPGLALMRRMTLVSQRAVLFNTTVYNNIAYGLKARGLSAPAIKERVAEALDAGGLSHLAHARAGTLSGGEAQRAALVRAWALRPELLLLDEPTASMDPAGVTLAEGLIHRMRDEDGTTVVMVTHNLFQARRLADRVYLLYAGELVEHGDTGRMFSSPREELTRRFVSGEEVY